MMDEMIWFEIIIFVDFILDFIFHFRASINVYCMGLSGVEWSSGKSDWKRRRGVVVK